MQGIYIYLYIYVYVCCNGHSTYKQVIPKRHPMLEERAAFSVTWVGPWTCSPLPLCPGGVPSALPGVKEGAVIHTMFWRFKAIVKMSIDEDDKPQAWNDRWMKQL